MKKLLYFIGEDTAFLTHRFNLAKAAQTAGFEVHVLTRFTTHESTLKNAGFITHGLKFFSRGGMNPFRDLLCLQELILSYRRIKPDCVHHVAWKPVLYGSIAAQITKVSKVINALTGMGYLFISQSIKAWLVRTIVQFLLPRILKSLNHIMILQNPDDYALAKDFLKIPSHHLKIIEGSGVDIKVFKPAASFPKGRLQFICVSRMLWDKGIRELVEATRLVKLTHASFDVILCGDTDPHNPAAIPSDQLRQWERQGLIKWKGRINDVASIYKQGHVAILPSYREGLPKALLEAAACGLPIITTDVPGCSLVVQNHKTGLLVPPKNYRKLAEAMVQLLTNPSLRADLGHNGRQLVVERFSDPVIIKQFLDVYSS